MHGTEPLFARLTLGFSLAGFLALALGIMQGDAYPNLLMELGFSSVLAAWLSWGLSEVSSRMARIRIPVKRSRPQDY